MPCHKDGYIIVDNVARIDNLARILASVTMKEGRRRLMWARFQGSSRVGGNAGFH